MSIPIERSFESAHSAEEVWRAINTPLATDDIRELVYPWTYVNYGDLGEDGQMQAGTGIAFVPTEELVEKVPDAFRSRVPSDINLRLVEHNSDNRLRIDAVESSKAEGFVRYRVEEGPDNSSLLIAEGVLSIGGMLRMAEGMAIEHGVYQPAQRTLDHLSQIL